MLKIQFKDKRRPPIWVVEKRYTIGSSPDNHLVIDSNTVSPHHARLHTQDKTLILKDNNSQYGCYVNDQRVTEREILPGDSIRIGDIELDILDPRESLSQPILSDDMLMARWSLVSDSSWLAGQEFVIPNTKNILGRGSQCDLVIPGTHLSRQHAELTIKGNLLHIRDLASSNGTYINDERVKEGIARPGDRLRFDVYSFRLVGPNTDIDQTRVRRAPSSLTTIERKNPSTEPKSWKTKATSPGNRDENQYSKDSHWFFTISLSLCAAMLVALFYLLTQA